MPRSDPRTGTIWREPQWPPRVMAYGAQYRYYELKVPCAGGCGTLVAGNRYAPDHPRTATYTGLCNSCAGAKRAAPNVREGELRCTRCGVWKPDSEFHPRPKHRARRGKASWCKQCDHTQRRVYRQKGGRS